jgi:RNA polymerase-binding transcription factor DksA
VVLIVKFRLKKFNNYLKEKMMAKKIDKKSVKKAVKKIKPESKKKTTKTKEKKTAAKKTTSKKNQAKVPKKDLKKIETKTEKEVKKSKKVDLPIKKEKKSKKPPKEIKIISEVKKQVEETIQEENELDIQLLAELEAARRRAEALKKIKKYSKKELEHFKSIIIEKQNEIIEQLQNLRDQMLDPSTGEYINENSPYSLHMAEQGTDAMEREKTFLYAQRETKFLSYLEEALKRIEDGTYGICSPCVEDPQYLCPTCPLIPKERLEAVPHTQLCLPMKQRQEKK